MFYASDLISQYIPWYYLTQQYLRNFTLPHWVPDIYSGGYPLLAEGESGALSPINALILLIFPFPVALNLLYLVYLTIAALGMYKLLREIKLEQTSAALGAFVFIFSGFFISRYFQPSIIFAASFLPFAIFVILRSVENKISLFTLPVIIFLQITAGHLQIALISIFAQLAFALLLVLKKTIKLDLLLKLTLAIFLGIGLSSPQLLPSMNLFRLSERQSWDPAIKFSYSLPPSHLVTYLLPNYFGVSQPGDDLNFNQIGGGFWELNLTIWTLPFLLAIVGVYKILKGSKKNIAVAFLIIWLVSLLLSFGGYFKPNLLFYNSDLYPFRAPARFLLIATFAVTILCSIGFNFITRKLKKVHKISLALIVVISICLQAFLQLKNYFIFKEYTQVEKDLQGISTTNLSTPLQLIPNQKINYENIFRQEFNKGMIIFMVSIIVILVLIKIERRNLSNIR